MNKVTVFKKEVEFEKDGRKQIMPVFYGRLADSDLLVQVQFSTVCGANINADIKTKTTRGKFPCDVILENPNDYFFTTEEYEKDGKKQYKDKLVIMAYTSIAEPTLKSITIEDYVSSKQAVASEQDNLPF